MEKSMTGERLSVFEKENSANMAQTIIFESSQTGKIPELI
jgi:hypothetical protein